METQKESVCCAECPKVRKKVIEKRRQSDSDNQKVELKCITEVRGFETVCLNPDVLETAYVGYEHEHGHLNTTQAEKFRYMGYRQLVWWCHKRLGRSIRVPLPSCAVTQIRKAFPNDMHTCEGL